MEIKFSLSEQQEQFLKQHPEFNINNWFNTILNEKINKVNIKNKKINVIIAAAGYDERISKVEADIPKAMLKIKGKSLLERQIAMLRGLGISDITVIRGYKKEEINLPDINYVDNDNYDKTGILYSFFLASEKMVGKTILLYADIIVDKDIIEKLIFETEDFAIVVDKSWREHYHHRTQHTISEAELVEATDDKIKRIGFNIPYELAKGEFIGLSAFSETGAEKAKKFYQNFKMNSDKKVYNSSNYEKASLSDFFNALIDEGENVTPVNIHGGWFEIDTFEDYREAWTKV